MKQVNAAWLALFALALFMAGNAQMPVTDPVESNYALTAKEMLLSQDFISPRIYGNYWYDKPVFFYWELIAAFKAFGITEFAARFFPAVFGLVGVIMTYIFAKKIYDTRTALISGLILTTSLGYFIVSKLIITDMTFFVFFNAVLVFFYIAYTGKRKSWYYMCYISAGLAVLTKGPIGILLPGLIVTLFIAIRRDWREIPRMKPLGFVLFLLIVSAWYFPMYLLHGQDFLETFLGVHNVLRATQSEHPRWDVWYYYGALFFLLFFPWSFVTAPQAALKYIREYRANNSLPHFDKTKTFLLTWALTITIFYQLMATKYPTYSLPSLLPVAILAARFLIGEGRDMMIKRIGIIWTLTLAIFIGFAASPLTETNYSNRDTAMFLRENVKDGDLLVSFGEYKASIVYYSELNMLRLESAAEIEALRPVPGSWTAKNVMPFIAIEDLPFDRTIYLVLNSHRYEDIDGTHYLDDWKLLRTFPKNRVYVKEPITK